MWFTLETIRFSRHSMNTEHKFSFSFLKALKTKYGLIWSDAGGAVGPMSKSALEPLRMRGVEKIRPKQKWLKYHRWFRGPSISEIIMNEGECGERQWLDHSCLKWTIDLNARLQLLEIWDRNSKCLKWDFFKNIYIIWWQSTFLIGYCSVFKSV